MVEGSSRQLRSDRLEGAGDVAQRGHVAVEEIGELLGGLGIVGEPPWLIVFDVLVEVSDRLDDVLAGAPPVEVAERGGDVLREAFSCADRCVLLRGRTAGWWCRWRSVVTRLTALPKPLARCSLARATRRSMVKSVSLVALTSLVIHQRSASVP